MQKTTRKKIIKWLKILVLVYIAGGFFFYYFQEKFLFHPQKLEPSYTFTFPVPFEEINLPVSNDKNLSIVRFTVPDSICKGVVVYLHGNRRNIERYGEYVQNFTRNNYQVWMMDYPGFGKTTGKLTEEALYKDALQLYKMARARYSPDSIIIYGKSLGTGIAAYLAANTECKRLILETPYYSMHSLMRHYAFFYPVSLLAKYELPTNEYLQRVQVPVSLIHGSSDEIIPYSQSQHLLQEAKPGTELITIPKGKHNNLSDFPLFQHKLDSLLRH